MARLILAILTVVSTLAGVNPAQKVGIVIQTTAEEVFVEDSRGDVWVFTDDEDFYQTDDSVLLIFEENQIIDVKVVDKN